jgi:glycosyltransferase involved in cell wall biosynthesis
MQAETRVINRAVLQEVPSVNPGERGNYILFPSAIEARKGVRLAVHALAFTPPHVRLIFAAGGYEQEALERLVQRLGIADRIEFRGRIPRAEMLRMMVDAAAVVCAGLREEGGCALSEAMQLGVPVIVLGHGGARIVAAANTDPSRVALIEPRSVKRIVRDVAAAMTRFSTHPSAARGSYLDRAGTKIALQQALRDALVKSADSAKKRQLHGSSPSISPQPCLRPAHPDLDGCRPG